MDSIINLHTSNVSDLESLDLSQLMVQKTTIENELNELIDILDNNHVGMNTPLVTIDGFPRDDIDVLQIRVTRTRIIRLKNDLKDVLSLIQNKMETHYAENNNNSSSNEIEVEVETKYQNSTPFAIIDDISENGPAYKSGLRLNDKIIEFGGYHAMNHDGLKMIGRLVQKSENVSIKVQLIRSQPTTIDPATSIVEIDLIPSQWEGRGLLGCHLKPL